MVRGECGKKTFTINLCLHGNLARFGGERTGFSEIVVSSSDSLESLINRFCISKGEIGLIIVNEVLIRDYTIPLKPGDQIRIFGLAGGG